MAILQKINFAGMKLWKNAPTNAIIQTITEKAHMKKPIRKHSSQDKTTEKLKRGADSMEAEKKLQQELDTLKREMGMLED